MTKFISIKAQKIIYGQMNKVCYSLDVQRSLITVEENKKNKKEKDGIYKTFTYQ